MATEEGIAAGLIDWVNSLGVADPIKNISSLNDGSTIWRLLQQVDNISFPGNLPEDTRSNDDWVSKWTNLKHLYDALTIFLVEECGQKLPLFHSYGRTRPDLKGIAQHASMPDTILLLKLCVVAAINCADRIEFLTRMQTLGPSTQEVLMATAQEAGESEGDEEGTMSTTEDNIEGTVAGHTTEPSSYQPSRNVDLDLASEERLARVIADNESIAAAKREADKQLEELYNRYDKLQQKHDRAQEELQETNERLTAVLSGRVEGGQQKPDARSESVIAALEGRVDQMEAENEELKKTNEVLRIKADRVQKLQDDFDEIKIERDRLSRKANTAEKYRQKLESIQDIEKENQSLKDKVSELQTQIRQNDSSQTSSSNLQREVDEYRRLLPSLEQELHDLNEMKKRVEFDYHTLSARWHDLNDDYQRSQNQVGELRERLQDYEDGTRPSTPTKAQPKDHAPDIEAEEAAFAEAEARLTEALLKSSNNNVNNGDEKTSETENGISEDELRAIMSAMRAQAQAGTATERDAGTRAQKKLLVALDRQRSRNQTLTEHIKKQSDLIKELKDIQESAAATAAMQPPPREPTPPPPPPKDPVPLPQPQRESTSAELAAASIPSSLHESKLVELMMVTENLKREIRLMTSAWYEQNQRLVASSTAGGSALSLMRSKMGRSGGGLEEPKSFLGRQRRVVDAIVLGNGSPATALKT